MSYYIYILECKDRTLYCGYTNDLDARLKTHNLGKGAKYTKGRTPTRLLYSECFESKSEALKREAVIKKLSRSQKIELMGIQISEYGKTNNDILVDIDKNFETKNSGDKYER